MQSLYKLYQKLDEERLKEWLKKWGPEETAYACLYRAEDIELVRQFFVKEKFFLELEDNKLTDYFFNQCERKLNDHEAEIEIEDTKFPIIDCAKACDLPSIQGLSYLAKAHFTTFAKPQYMGVGNDSREARPYHSKLYGELGTRADMNVGAQGSITRVNQSLKFIGIFPSTFPTITAKEVAVYNMSSGYTSGTQFNRVVFDQYAIPHTVNTTAFTVSILENFSPITKWG